MAAEKQAPPRPTITLPPRPSMDTLFTGGLSPGPMTLVSSFFSDNYLDSDSRSFSQLLAGAMASPIARPSFFTDASSNKQDGLDNSANLGFKQSRPMNLVVAHHSPLFTVPPGLSPSGLLNSPGFFSPPQSPFGMSHQQALAQVTAQAALAAQNHMHLQAQYQPAPVSASTELLTRQPSFTPGEASQLQMLPSTSEPHNSMVEASDLSHSDRKQQPPLAVDKPSDDGYNWRKYGQKPIKGSEYPRSYYKCTHLNCPVKKKVERSSDGQITEIIYKGLHSHEQPQPNKRAKDSSDQNGSTSSQAKPEPGSLSQAGNINKSNETFPAHSVHGMEQEPTQANTELPGSSDSEEAGEMRAEDGNEDEPNPKRRQTDVGTSEVALPHKTVTEPKIIVQTRSEVDLLDDGYRWRKYGQKLVKGNPHPRSYYKCTSAGCNVRKHVERAAADPKAVVTTYEGKHNHDVPAARNSSHNTANNSALQLKPQKVVAEKHPFLFGNNDKRPVLLQLKEEEIAV
ncbi:probable WRKY transcription factor 4 [Ricinus communis]|uniref:WRKY transcription factor, putative n=1 Tax=Ricinus communis TaxID=3988 RepID=B9SVK5_RICCO|nr:probable WRKY transcription factor 4 [Ricinus communis]EEF32386.1 WRKY transcription factor, putative [Ricinus communis]|eukprot:XP_015581380.1 probable WRKY transcription factor 4 [Ricinus communis]